MALFQKKTTVVHHITYMGLMTAINLIFIILARFAPMMMFLLILLLPFSSAVVAYFCKKKFYIIYAIATIGLCLIFSLSDTIFYVVPAVISGFAIGVLLDNQIHPFWLVLISSIINAAISIAFIPLVDLLSNVPIVETILKAVKLTDFQYKLELVYMFVYFLSLLQCALTNFVLLADAKKIGIEIKEGVKSFAPYIIGLELTVILSISFAFFFKPLAFVFLIMSFYFATYLLFDLLISKKIIVYTLLIILFIGSFVFFAIFYTKLPAPLGLLLFLLFPISMGITSFIKNYLLKAESNI